MCASLMRPTNTWLSPNPSLSLISFATSLLSSPLLLYTLLPSPRFLLSKFISLQVLSLPPLLPLIPHCLSLPLFPPNAVRLTTLFPFKIKIIKSSAKWERVCCWRHYGSTLMFYFSAIVSTSTHQSQTTVAIHTQSHTYSQVICSHPIFHLLLPTSLSYFYSEHNDEFDMLSSTVLGPQRSLILSTFGLSFLPSPDLSISPFF